MTAKNRKTANAPEHILPGNGIGWMLAVLLLLIVFGAITSSYSPVRWGTALFLVAVLARKHWDLFPCALLFVLMFVVTSSFPEAFWNVPAAWALFPFFATCLICLPFPHLRSSFQWARWGEPDQISWLATGLVSLVSAAALVLWALWANYLGVATAMIKPVLSMPYWFLFLVALPGFALVNAFAEEVVYRGVIQDALERRFADKQWLVISLQALAFAAAHYQVGFPNGKVGFAMVFVYGSMLGFLRVRSLGMLAPYVAHVAADYVIGVVLVLMTS